MQPGPIYIGGLDRCGKSTLRAFLVSHPEIAIPAVGSNMWTYFYEQYGDLVHPANLEKCLADMLHYKHIRFLQPDPERIRAEFHQGPATYARLFALFLIHFAEREGKPRWGAQTGLIERYAPLLFAAYPGLKIIHMVRDPRDRYEASLARWPHGKGRAGGAVARWRYSMQLAEKNRRLFPHAYKIARFESLIQQPEETLRELCAFLETPYFPEMLAMNGAPRQRDRLLAGTATTPGSCPLSPEFIGRFRDRIPPHEIAFIQLHAGRMMQRYGYELETHILALSAKIQFAMWHWPNQMARLLAWRSVEAMQHHFPRLVGRRPGERMIIAEPLPSVATQAPPEPAVAPMENG